MRQSLQFFIVLPLFNPIDIGLLHISYIKKYFFNFEKVINNNAKAK